MTRLREKQVHIDAQKKLHSMLYKATEKKDINWSSWGRTDKSCCGTLCLDIIKVQTSIIEIVDSSKRSKSKRKPMKVVRFTEGTKSNIDYIHHLAEFFSPNRRPMVWWPKPWTSVTSGGYLSGSNLGISLVKAHHKDQLEDVLPARMPEVFKAVNGLQRCPGGVLGPITLSVLGRVAVCQSKSMSRQGRHAQTGDRALRDRHSVKPYLSQTVRKILASRRTKFVKRKDIWKKFVDTEETCGRMKL